MEEDKFDNYNEIIYYFKEIGLIIYSEYKLKKRPLSKENIISKYDIFLNDNEIKPLIKSKINHKICFHYYHNLNLEGNQNYKLSIKLNDLKINYYNFILICNLVHYYNEFYDTNTEEVLFLLEQMKKFSKIIFEGKIIKDTKDGLILILLFLYYYSILAIHLYKNSYYKVYQDEEPASTFYDFMQIRVNTLFGECFEDPKYQKYEKILNNDFINLKLDSLNIYSERKNNKKLEFFIRFIKFILLIMYNDNNDEKQHNFDYSMIQYSEINPNVRINLVLRKAFFGIINGNVNNIGSSLEDLKKIKDYFFKDNENPEIEYYYTQIIQSNANLLSFSKNKIDINKENIEKIKNIPYLSEISKKYHEYNIKLMEYIELIKEKEDMIKKKNENKKNQKENNNEEITNIDKIKEEMKKNKFFIIIFTYNFIVLKTKEYKNKDPNKEKERDQILADIFTKVESFCDDLIKIKDEDKNNIKFISNNNYLKTLISRIFYNYFVLKIIKKKQKFNNVPFKKTFESFEDITKTFNIKNFLVDKISADIFCINKDDKNMDEAKINYAKINNDIHNRSLSSLFGYAFCSNISHPDGKKYDMACINVLDLILAKLKSDPFKYDINLLENLESLKEKIKQNF